MNKKIYGLFFMAIAVFILVVQLNVAIFQSISPMFWTVVFGFFLIKGILKMSWFTISLSSFLMINMYNDMYHFLSFPPIILLFILGVFFIGFSMVFKQSMSIGIKKPKISYQYNQQNALSSVAKYIEDKELEQFTYVAKMSQVTLYFDNAELKYDTAVFDLDVKLSEVTLYLPKHWAVINEMRVTLGEINQRDKKNPTTKTIYLRGKVALGALKIIYV